MIRVKSFVAIAIQRVLTGTLSNEPLTTVRVHRFANSNYYLKVCKEFGIMEKILSWPFKRIIRKINPKDF